MLFDPDFHLGIRGLFSTVTGKGGLAVAEIAPSTSGGRIYSREAVRSRIIFDAYRLYAKRHVTRSLNLSRVDSVFVLDRSIVQVKFPPMGTVTYTEAREKLASLWDEVVSSREALVIKRRGHPDIALLPADELSSLMETAHLLRSPENTRCLLEALKRARSGKGRTMTVDELRKKSGIDATGR